MKRAATTTPSPAACPICCRIVSVKRIEDLGADAVKILIYYSPFDEPDVNDIKHAFIERIGAECEYYEIPFFLRVRRLRSGGRRRERSGIRQEEARSGDGRDGRIWQAAIQSGRVESGSADQRRVCGRQQRVQGAERRRRTRKRWNFTAKAADIGGEAVHLPERRREQRGIRGDR